MSSVTRALVKMGTKLNAYMIYKIGPKSGSPISPSRTGHYTLTGFQPPLKSIEYFSVFLQCRIILIFSVSYKSSSVLKIDP